MDHICFKHPFTALVAGPSGSGKTVLVRSILENHSHLIRGTRAHPKVLWAYGVWQPLYEQPIKDVEIHYTAGLPTEEYVKTEKPVILVIDDLMTQLSNNANLADLFTKGSHHYNLSVIFLVQNVFHQGRRMRDISLNSHYIILMKNPRDKQQVMTLARQIFPGKTKHFLESYEDATAIPYGYIKIDLKPDTPENLRLRTRITPINRKFSPIVYMLKDVNKPSR